jgi:hypothetical protein
MQGSKGCVYYAGAWCGYGFHEDGMRSAVDVMDALGLALPWVPVATDPKSSLWTVWLQHLVSSYAGASLHTGRIRIIYPSGAEATFGQAGEAPCVGYRVVPSFLVVQPPQTGSGRTAVHMNLSKHWDREHNVLTAPGPSPYAAASVVRVLRNETFSAVVHGGSSGLVHAYAARHFEVNDLGAFCQVLAKNWEQLGKNNGKLGVLHWLGTKPGAAVLRAQHLGNCREATQAYSSMELLIDNHGVIHDVILGMLHIGAVSSCTLWARSHAPLPIQPTRVMLTEYKSDAHRVPGHH